MGGMQFEWDAGKARRNIVEHAVSFDEAATVFADTLSMSRMRRLLVVSYTERKDKVRIISARTATRAERRAYEEAE